jgi:diguanylate cyclase (GGDEF)-like protein
MTRLSVIFQYLKSVVTVPRDPELVQAELAAFSKQVPLMYLLVIVNMTALAITHYNAAPRSLTVYAPVALYALCGIRMLSWWRVRTTSRTVEQAIKRLRGTILAAGLLGACFTAWSLSLFPYGDAYAQSHVAFFMAVTVIGCGFCLTHLRAAMLLVMGLVVIPFTIYFFSTGNPTLVMISLNFVFVAFTVVFMLLVNYQGFEELVVSQKALRRNQDELQALNDQNFTFSNTDSLTSLPNRRRFFTELEERVRITKRDDQKLALGILDLDGFKAVNDAYGHLVGDELIVLAGERLRATLETTVFLARLGGDEFVVAMGYAVKQDVIELGEAIREALAAPFRLAKLTVRIGCTVGFACFPRPADSAQQLFEQADYALYFAKHHDRGGVAIYSAEHEATVRKDGVIAQALANADVECEFWMAYQPIIDAKTMQPIAFEALARWESPILGNVSPAEFIPSAERSGLISRITPILLRKALNDAREWPPHIRLSFNLSAVDVNSPLTVLNIIQTLASATIAPSRVDFEVTETALMLDLKQASEALTALKQAGARIALDDFGTGFSSLSSIRQLPLDEIKIDRSFVTAIDTDYSTRVIMKSMINLCENLGLDCVVEGIESEQQLAILLKEGALSLQGYFFERPMPGGAVSAYLVAQSKIEQKNEMLES